MASWLADEWQSWLSDCSGRAVTNVSGTSLQKELQGKRIFAKDFLQKTTAKESLLKNIFRQISAKEIPP